MTHLFNRYNDLLNAGLEGAAPYSTLYEYEEGDMLFIDNLAVAHRASPDAVRGRIGSSSSTFAEAAFWLTGNEQF